MIKPKSRAGAIGITLGVAVLAGTGAALAASFGAGQGQLGASSLSANCQATTMTPTWDITYNASLPGYQVTSIELTGIQATCLDLNVKAVLANTSGVSQLTGAGSIPTTGSAASISLASAHPLTDTWPSQLVLVIYE